MLRGNGLTSNTNHSMISKLHVWGAKNGLAKRCWVKMSANKLIRIVFQAVFVTALLALSICALKIERRQSNNDNYNNDDDDKVCHDVMIRYHTDDVMDWHSDYSEFVFFINYYFFNRFQKPFCVFGWSNYKINSSIKLYVNFHICIYKTWKLTQENLKYTLVNNYMIKSELKFQVEKTHQIYSGFKRTEGTLYTKEHNAYTHM